MALEIPSFEETGLPQGELTRAIYNFCAPRTALRMDNREGLNFSIALAKETIQTVSKQGGNISDSMQAAILLDNMSLSMGYTADEIKEIADPEITIMADLYSNLGYHGYRNSLARLYDDQNRDEPLATASAEIRKEIEIVCLCLAMDTLKGVLHWNDDERAPVQIAMSDIITNSLTHEALMLSELLAIQETADYDLQKLRTNLKQCCDTLIASQAPVHAASLPPPALT